MSAAPRTAMVVPSNRPAQLREFLAQWSPYPWDATIVVEDAPQPSLLIGAPVDQHLCWADLERDLGADAWIISRRDSGVRAFGFLHAVALGADVVLTLDDDCFPATPAARTAFCTTHIGNLDAPPCWASSVPGVRVRGLPYGDGRGTRTPRSIVNMGLWTGTADLDSVQTLLGSPFVREFAPSVQTQIVSRHHYLPFCGMNVAFRAEALPAMYFPRMGDGSPYRRFDDIWCGLVMQRVFAHLDWVWTVGTPTVVHTRLSDPLVNLEKEAPGISAHEDYWRVVDAAPLAATTLAGCVAEMAAHLGAQKDPYLREWGRALSIWIGRCRAVAAGAAARHRVPLAAAAE